VHSWVLLHYKIPPEPTARRVFVWRKLKRLGAILVHDAVWVLPATPYTREQLQWLAAEIAEFGGDALQWEARLPLAARDEALAGQFVAQVDAAYDAILAELARGDADLAALSRRYRQVQAQDYFHSERGEQVRAALTAAGGGDDP
jgi:hypothetical protein